MSSGEDKGAEVVDLHTRALHQIREATLANATEIRATNARLDQTNARLDQTNARLDQTNQKLENVTEAVRELVGVVGRVSDRVEQVSDRLEALAVQVANNSDQIRTLAAVMESGFREMSRAIDTRADVGRVRQLEERVERLERKVG